MQKRFIAEFIATFALVFCGTGAMVINDFTGGTVSHAGVAITFGLIVMAMIYAYGDISGAHMNPAVTIGFAFAKKFPWKEVPYYAVAQIGGAFLASGILYYLFPESETLGATLPQIDVFKVFIFEIILTFFLMLVIINISTGSKEIGVIAGIAIGSVVLLEAMFAGPITGASMNPARSISPAVVSGNMQHLWLYIIGPIIGCIIAVLCAKLVKPKDCFKKEC
ncbi:MAG: MIP/aquaporin family protein [Patiriisocius sp.]|uniref:MIP/aquaporin family protein n=1 Tax=Patiriisocius sp. TaxID=2822396 RepID=UPI003EF5766B